MAAETTREQDKVIEHLSIEYGGEPLHITDGLGGQVAVHLPGVPEPVILDEDGNTVPVPAPLPRVVEGEVTASLIDDRWIVTLPARYTTAMAVPDREGLHATVHVDEDTARDLMVALTKALPVTEVA